MNKKPQNFAKLVAERMNAAEVSNYRLEQLTGIPRQTIGQFLNGKSDISATKLAKIFAALDIVTAVQVQPHGKE